MCVFSERISFCYTLLDSFASSAILMGFLFPFVLAFVLIETKTQWFCHLYILEQKQQQRIILNAFKISMKIRNFQRSKC